MLSFLSPDSRFMRIMSRVGDLLVLNLLFLICSLPVVTIGASATALYAVCLRLDTSREAGLFRGFFQALVQNLGQATALWLILLLGIVSSAVSGLFLYSLGGVFSWLSLICWAMLLLVLMAGAYVFPLQSQFSNGILSTLRNAVFLGLGYLPRSVLLAAISIAPLICLLLDFWLFMKLGFLWAILYFSCAAYANSLLLKKVFAPYLPEEEP